MKDLEESMRDQWIKEILYLLLGVSNITLAKIKLDSETHKKQIGRRTKQI
jgi:hypothetical protein